MVIRNMLILAFLLISQLFIKASDISNQLFKAIGKNDYLLVDDLVNNKGADIRARDFNGRTPLHYASSQGNRDIVWFLIKKGVDVNIKDDFNRTSLHDAIFKGNKDIVEFLLVKGANVNDVDDNNITPLHESIKLEYPEISKILISYGAQTDIKEKIHQKTPVQLAFNKGYKELVNLLIQEGAKKSANIDSQDDEGKTILHYAAQNGITDLVKTLIANGANIHIKDNNGETPADIARKWANNTLANLIEELGKI